MVVENVQEGEDDCKEYLVGREQLQELLDTVDRVLESTQIVDGDVVTHETFEDGKWVPHYERGKVLEDATVAKELLPTQSGFFFGDTDYDDWYWENLQDTKRIITEALKNDDGCDFYYQSSW